MLTIVDDNNHTNYKNGKYGSAKFMNHHNLVDQLIS